MLPIDTTLPIVKEGDEAIVLSADWMNLLHRKLNALWNMQGVNGTVVIKAEAGFKIEPRG